MATQQIAEWNKVNVKIRKKRESRIRKTELLKKMYEKMDDAELSEYISQLQLRLRQLPNEAIDHRWLLAFEIRVALEENGKRYRAAQAVREGRMQGAGLEEGYGFII